ncbi:hypothetical protein GCM10028819_25020 [Spirosoma humi]
MLNGQYHHISLATYSDAQSVLQNLSKNTKRVPVGIYDAKTELFEWEPDRQKNYNQASIEEQGRLADQIVTIAQALRRRDASWQPASMLRRPSFFA